MESSRFIFFVVSICTCFKYASFPMFLFIVFIMQYMYSKFTDLKVRSTSPDVEVTHDSITTIAPKTRLSACLPGEQIRCRKSYGVVKVLVSVTF